MKDKIFQKEHQGVSYMKFTIIARKFDLTDKVREYV